MKIDNQAGISIKILEKIKFGIKQCLSENITSNDETELFIHVGNQLGRALDLYLTTRLPCETIVDFQYPSTWFQQLKERWFPTWLKKKYPVRYSVAKVFRVHPDIKLPHDADRVNMFIQDELSYLTRMNDNDVI
jgi:hypothetical protein